MNDTVDFRHELHICLW